MTLQSFLQEASPQGFLSLVDHTQATTQFGVSYREVERIALSANITPLRYQRNQSTITVQQQAMLFDSSVAIIGCGGLGGHVAEIMTRIGIGKLSLFDFDYFEEHNLNRQNFSTIASLGKDKVTVIKEALEQINPSVQIDAFVHRFDPLQDMPMIHECVVVVDALDNPAIKLSLAKACKAQHKHFIHGAIAGMHGQFSTDNLLEKLYPDGGRGAELHSGNPPFSVTFAASIQAAEAIKAILGIGDLLNDSFMVADLLDNEFEKFPL